MAFYISKQGNPETILTDGSSLQLGTGLSIDNGTINVTGGGATPSFEDITGDPEDNEKLAEALDLKADVSDLQDYIPMNGTTEILAAQQINFYAIDEGETGPIRKTRTVGRIKPKNLDQLDSSLVIEFNTGLDFKMLGSNDILSFNLPDVSYQIDGRGTPLSTSWANIINTANGQSEAYAKSTELTQTTQKLEEDELVISSALNDLNDRISAIERKLEMI